MTTRKAFTLSTDSDLSRSTPEAGAGPVLAGAWRPDPVVTVLVVLLVVTQRLGIPLGDSGGEALVVPVSLPLVFGLVALMVVRGTVGISRLRVELYALAALGVLLATGVSAVLGAPLAMSSLLLLLVIYLPWVIRSRGPGFLVARQVGMTFVRTMTVLAVVGVGQLSTQLLGYWQYQDVLADVINPDWLVPGFNTNNPLVYASPVIKANAFILLEPSFMSQFCALAVLIGIMLGVRSWQLLVLVAGVASAVSGTGIILLLTGGVLVLLRARPALRPGQIVAAALAVGLVLVTPVAPLLLNRTDETTQAGSSGYLRFVQPYLESSQALDADPIRYVVGAGAGGADRLLVSQRAGQLGEAVTYTIVPKLVFEYGLIAGGIFVLFLLFALLDGAAWRVVPGSLLVMTFLLSGALLQPQTAFLAWLLTAFCSHEGPLRTSPPSGPLPPGGRPRPGQDAR